MFRLFWKKRQRKERKPGFGTKGAKDVEILLAIHPGACGEYAHTFSGSEFVNDAGDMDFRSIKGPVAVTLHIDAKSERGVAFSAPADNAIALAPEKFAERGRCPAALAYKSDQFTEFRLEDNNSSLRFFNRNDDGGVYFYALRFLNARGCAHVYDPKVHNGDGGHN